MAIGGAGIVFNVAKAAAEAFGPLKGALEAASTVYDQYKVRSFATPVVKFLMKNKSRKPPPLGERSKSSVLASLRWRSFP